MLYLQFIKNNTPRIYLMVLLVFSQQKRRLCYQFRCPCIYQCF